MFRVEERRIMSSDRSKNQKSGRRSEATASATRLDHIGIAVRSIEEALALYRDLGIAETHREQVPSQGCVAAFLPIGDTRLELLEPTGSSSPVAKFLEKRGPGIHHLCFAVSDIDSILADLAARGYRLIHRQAVSGADGKRVAFLHPESGHGVLVELSQEAGEESGL
jgi:methylmalonyl-CoA epimerase